MYTTRSLAIAEIARRRLLHRSRSFKVTDDGTNRKLVYDFLLVINSNWHPMRLLIINLHPIWDPYAIAVWKSPSLYMSRDSLTCFTELHQMQTRSSDKNSVCLSVKRVLCDKMEERSVHIFISYERSFSLVFWEEEWFLGVTPCTWNFGSTAPVGADSPILNR